MRQSCVILGSGGLDRPGSLDMDFWTPHVQRLNGEMNVSHIAGQSLMVARIARTCVGQVKCPRVWL